jgi:hypothetical protein
MLTVLTLALALTAGQAGNQAFAGTWIAEFEGKTYVRVERWTVVRWAAESASET